MRYLLLTLLLSGCTLPFGSVKEACNDMVDDEADKLVACGIKAEAFLESDRNTCDHLAPMVTSKKIAEECLPAIDDATCEDLKSGKARFGCDAIRTW